MFTVQMNCGASASDGYEYEENMEEVYDMDEECNMDDESDEEKENDSTEGYYIQMRGYNWDEDPLGTYDPITD